MITIEKAIKHCEEVAKEQVRLYRLCPSEYDCNGLSDCKALADGRNKGCLKRANENRQLAEWLKKLNLLIQLIENGEKESEDLNESKKETIEILKDLWRYEHSEYPEKDIRKALDMAIKALEQEPCEGAVSRKAVIEHICEGKDCYKKNCKGVLYNRCPDIEWVNELPTVTPQEPILDKIRAEIKGWQVDIHDNEYDADKHDFVFERIFEIIDEYKTESEG